MDLAAPLSPEGLLAILADWGIAAPTISHPPVYTVEEAKSLRGTIPGAHVKNLFLRGKKREFWLLTASEDQPIDLKSFAATVGAGRFSFGSPEMLMIHLGVEPGSVTPLSLVNDRDRQVRFILDRSLLAGPVINCHPLTNRMTSSLTPEGLLTFLERTGHNPILHDFKMAMPESRS